MDLMVIEFQKCYLRIVNISLAWGFETNISLDMPHKSRYIPFYVFAPIENSILIDRVYRSFVVTINGYDMLVDLFLLDMIDFESMLGMG